MTPGARLQAAIELLDQIAASGVPADHLVGNYFRSRRYAGSKDRRAVNEMVYDVLRRRGEYSWRANSTDSRPLTLAHLMSLDDAAIEAVALLFDGSTYGPAELDGDETAILEKLAGTADEDAPPWASGNYPEWLHGALERRFDANLDAEMAAMGGRAEVDLRINALKDNVGDVATKLAAEDIPTTPGNFAPTALRLNSRRSLVNHPAYQNGVIEIQDEGSQLVALLCAAKPGQQMVDYCAGAGGKSLALAAQMDNKGQIFAFDKNPRRMRPLRERLQRAGARNLQIHALADPASAATLTNLQGKADRVLLDVPCSGSGAWRRNPESKWRLTSEQLAEYTETQTEILSRAAPLVAPGGRLIYATCSLLMAENEDQIDSFLSSHSDFEIMPVASVWDEVMESDCPSNKSGNKPGDDTYLRLTPAQHHTDGFFVAIMQRKQT